MRHARATKDIDLTLAGGGKAAGEGEEAERIRGLLQQASSVKLPDEFIFVVGESVLELDAPPEGGSRYPVHATMAGRTFARFRVDVGIGDASIDPADRVEGEGWFDFAGLPRPEFRMISREQQFAEKIHAYTLPRAANRENTRVKDLVDLLLLQATPMESQRVRENIRRTFERRNTHPVPVTLAFPPAAWGARFEMLAKDCGLSPKMEQAFQQLAAYFADLNRKG